MEIKVNVSDINDLVKYALKKTGKKLEEAKEIVTSITVPADFNIIKINKLNKNIEDWLYDIHNMNKQMDVIAKNFEQAENKNMSIIENNIGDTISVMGDKLINVTKNMQTHQYQTVNEKLKIVIDELIQVGLISGNDSEIVTIIRSQLNCNLSEEELINMTNKQIENEILKIILGKEKNVYDFFDFFNPSENFGMSVNRIKNLFWYETPEGEVVTPFSTKYYEYVNENVKLEKRTTIEYMQVINFMQSQFGISGVDAEKLVSIMASNITTEEITNMNMLVAELRKSPEKFEEIFGFPMYKKEESILYLSDIELMIALYMYINNTKNGGNLISTDENGRNVLNDDVTQTDENGSTEILKDKYKKEITLDAINEFIGDELNGENLHNTNAQWQEKYESEAINKWLEQGYYITLTVSESTITFEDMNVESDVAGDNIVDDALLWEDGTSKTCMIIKVTDQGYIVSHNGRECLVRFSQLKNNRANYIIQVYDMQETNQK